VATLPRAGVQVTDLKVIRRKRAREPAGIAGAGSGDRGDVAVVENATD
jgi:hypothetical protein